MSENSKTLLKFWLFVVFSMTFFMPYFCVEKYFFYNYEPCNHTNEPTLLFYVWGVVITFQIMFGSLFMACKTVDTIFNNNQ